MDAEYGHWSGYTLGEKIGMSQGTAVYLLGTKPRNFRDTTLRNIADAFGCDIREIRVMAGQPAGQAQPWQPPPEVNQLDDREIAALEEYIFLILRAHGRYMTR